MQVTFPLRLLWQGVEHPELTMLLGSQRHLGVVEVPHPVHEHHLVTAMKAQHADGMGSLLFWQLVAHGNVGRIEIPYFLHDVWSIPGMFRKKDSRLFSSSFMLEASR